jgi:hypothetical protein
MKLRCRAAAEGMTGMAASGSKAFSDGKEVMIQQACFAGQAC